MHLYSWMKERLPMKLLSIRWQYDAGFPVIVYTYKIIRRLSSRMMMCKFLKDHTTAIIREKQLWGVGRECGGGEGKSLSLWNCILRNKITVSLGQLLLNTLPTPFIPILCCPPDLHSGWLAVSANTLTAVIHAQLVGQNDLHKPFHAAFFHSEQSYIYYKHE